MEKEIIEVVSFRYADTSKFDLAREIRERVFVIEQEVDEAEEFDEFEATSEHYLLKLNGRAIGTARWREIGEKVKLERFAVDKTYRSKGYGEHLLRKVIEDASKLGRDLYMHAQLKAMPFYARQGFKQVGELFLECDIEHYKMIKLVD